MGGAIGKGLSGHTLPFLLYLFGPPPSGAFTTLYLFANWLALKAVRQTPGGGGGHHVTCQRKATLLIHTCNPEIKFPNSAGVCPCKAGRARQGGAKVLACSWVGFHDAGWKESVSSPYPRNTQKTDNFENNNFLLCCPSRSCSRRNCQTLHSSDSRRSLVIVASVYTSQIQDRRHISEACGT